MRLPTGATLGGPTRPPSEVFLGGLAPPMPPRLTRRGASASPAGEARDSPYGATLGGPTRPPSHVF